MRLHRHLIAEQCFYDGADVIADYGIFGRLKASYVTPFLDENLLVERYRLFGRKRTYWYAQDGLGSVRQLIDYNGSVQNSYAYTAWGVPLQWRETVPNRYTYTAREYNPETGDYYYPARHYSPFTARFLSRQSGYGYCKNNPLTYCDPTGEQEQAGGPSTYRKEILDAVVRLLNRIRSLEKNVDELRSEARHLESKMKMCDDPRFKYTLAWSLFKGLLRMLKNIEEMSNDIKRYWKKFQQKAQRLFQLEEHLQRLESEARKAGVTEEEMKERLARLEAQAANAKHYYKVSKNQLEQMLKETREAIQAARRRSLEVKKAIRSAERPLAVAARGLGGVTAIAAGCTAFEAARYLAMACHPVTHAAAGVCTAAGAVLWWVGYKLLLNQR